MAEIGEVLKGFLTGLPDWVGKLDNVLGIIAFVVLVAGSVRRLVPIFRWLVDKVASLSARTALLRAEWVAFSASRLLRAADYPQTFSAFVGHQVLKGISNGAMVAGIVLALFAYLGQPDAIYPFAIGRGDFSAAVTPGSVSLALMTAAVAITVRSMDLLFLCDPDRYSQRVISRLFKLLQRAGVREEAAQVAWLRKRGIARNTKGSVNTQAEHEGGHQSAK